MDKIWKKYILPLLIIIIGTLLYRFISGLHLNGSNFFLVIIKAFTYFAFGMSLCTYKKKRSSSWVGKLIISFIMAFYILYCMGLLASNNGIMTFLSLIGLLDSMAIPAIYALCGYLFFD